MPRDAQQQVDGDSQFTGMNSRLDPALLPPGMASEARNMRFRNGVAATRRGVYKPSWVNNLTPEIDNKVRPFGEIHGVGIFRNPDTNLEFVVIAADGKAHYTRQGNNPIELALPTGVTLVGEVNFVQAFNKLIMFRGDDFAPLVLVSEDTGFGDQVDQWDSTTAYAVDDEVAFGPLVSVSGITFSSGTATVTTGAAHGFITGADVTIAGANESEFNGRFAITKTSDTTFTFTTTSSNSAATGTITATNNKEYYQCVTLPSRSLSEALYAPAATALDGALYAPAATALDGGIDDQTTTTTVTVDSTAGYPDAGTILVGTEQITYTTKTGTEFSGGARAQGGTTIAVHANDAAVTYVHPATATITVNSTIGYPDSGTLLVGTEQITYTSKTDTEFSGGARAQGGTTIAAHSDNAEVTYVHPATVTVTVNKTDGYPTSGTILIGSEKLTYTGKTSTTFTTCTRGAESTTIAAHLIGAAVSSTSTLTSAGDSPSTEPDHWQQLSTIMPNATHGVHIANRIVVPTKFDASSTAYGNKQDFVAVSDSLDNVHTYFDQLFRINFGSNSEIQDLVVFDEQRLIILKDKDVHMVTGFIPTGTNATLSSSCSVQPVVQDYGVSNRGASVVVGGNVYFYASRRGIVSLAQTEQSKVRGVDLPLSESISKIIDRIDARNESKVRLAYWDNKLWVACPIDGGNGGENNALLVYDFLNQTWSGYDSGNAIKPKEFFIAEYNKSQRLYFIDTDGFINLVEENFEGDDVADLTKEDGLKNEEIESYILTRGYGQESIDHKTYRTASMNISVWNPKYTVKAKCDGVEESQTLCTDRTKSRTNYYRPFDALPFEQSNRDDDIANPYREDYSVTLDVDLDTLLTEAGDTIISETDEPILQEVSVEGFSLGTNGVRLDRMQQTMEPFALSPRTGRYTQFEVTNSQGRIELTQAHLTTGQGDRTVTVKS